jgi:hypothetical protein
MVLERLRRSFGFKIKSNTGSNESGRFLLALKSEAIHHYKNKCMAA